MTVKIRRIAKRGYLWIPVLVAAGLKYYLISSGSVPFNADEAIVALMARHIVEGEFPLFFYGQAYMGSLDAVLISLGFRAFGEHVWVIRVVQAALYLGTTAVSAELGYRFFGSKTIGLISGLLVAVPAVNVALYTTVTLGGYGELLLIGNLLILLTMNMIDKIKGPGNDVLGLFWQASAWGVFSGLGFWAFGFSLIYIIPAGILLFYHSVKCHRRLNSWIVWGGVLGGLLVGAIPLWIFIYQNDFRVLVNELTGGAIANVNQIPVLLKPFQRLFSLYLLGSTVIMGMRPPWTVNWLMLPLIPFTLAFWMGVFVSGIRKMFSESTDITKGVLLGGVVIVLLGGFLFSPFGNDPSGRYFIPLVVPLSLLGARMIVSWAKGRQLVIITLTGLILLFNLGGIIQSVKKFPPGLTTQFDAVTQVDHRDMDRLIRFLDQEGVDRGYTNYWVAYPLAFLSDEELVFIPRLPYHHDFRYTERDDRYPPYVPLVEESKQIGYITTNHPALNEYLRSQFISRGVDWSEAQIGDYQVFYNLSQIVRPEDIYLGTSTANQ